MNINLRNVRFSLTTDLAEHELLLCPGVEQSVLFNGEQVRANLTVRQSLRLHEGLS